MRIIARCSRIAAPVWLLALFLSSPQIAAGGCGCSHSSEPIVGAWAAEVSSPALGDVYFELNFDEDLIFSALFRNHADDPILKGVSMRGEYALSGDQIVVECLESWSGIEWVAADPTLSLSVLAYDILHEALAQRGDTKDWPIDFDGDGSADETWTLTKL